MRNGAQVDGILIESDDTNAFAAQPATLPGSPTEQLQALWEQHRVLDERGSEMYRSGAPRDQVGAWVAEKEALDARYRALKNQHPEWKPAASE